MRVFFAFLFVISTLYSCGADTLPKPKSYLTLQYPSPSYLELNIPCPYSFEISDQAVVEMKDNCWIKIEYPKLKATIHITYRSVQNNLDGILKEIEKLTFEHTIKADAINARPYENYNSKVFGKLYFIEGNVATNVQFRVTDSLNHVLAGALYFYAKPKYDSILPAVKYIEKDIVHLVETIQWKK
ncbi:MAG: gliding motility lipoprotein GldD [Lutibacter sp.]|nr:gliding motility lipoprotein GldD [Lutibacter sp.]MBP9600494.1 gliding motility lipoprotein GldD [Lutibacter sp.]